MTRGDGGYKNYPPQDTAEVDFVTLKARLAVDGDDE